MEASRGEREGGKGKREIILFPIAVSLSTYESTIFYINIGIYMWTEKINANSYTNLTFLLLLQLSSVSYWI
jgi:hypothetical protein